MWAGGSIIKTMINFLMLPSFCPKNISRISLPYYLRMCSQQGVRGRYPNSQLRISYGESNHILKCFLEVIT